MALNNNSLRFTDLIRLSTRVFFVKSTRTFLTILGMAVGISAVVFLISLGYGFQYLLLGKVATTEDSLITLSASYPSESGLMIQPQDADTVSKYPDTAEISRVAEYSGEVDYDKTSGLILIDEIENNYFRLSGTNPDIGGIPSPQTGGIILTGQAVKLLGLPVDAAILGKLATLKIEYQQDNQTTQQEANTVKPLPISGIFTDDTQPPIAYVYSAFMSQPPPAFSTILVKGKDLNSVEPLREQLIGKGFLVSAKVDLVNQARKIMNAITIVLAVFGITALVVSSIGMFNTMLVGFLERIYEVGVMKSLGATDADIRNLFLMEAMLMGFSGGVTGVGIGFGAGKLANFGLNLLARSRGGKPLSLFITPWWFVLSVVGTSMFIGLIAGAWPAYRASSLSPKEAFLRK
jgi:putative ABC transport system permease protein